ncbi:histone-fold-containing protein [Jaminaea rosea]|uniref:DNA polymerase epsilon subunit D n=1 Tax=Jaminaea rosea TaxID=1569628 RepID=A0A316UXW9_9BASI|nr:histone-fold-containing protein [Jaminaea rosea]PWN30150.1 histone-fold-containing protein [Jaminaea rosea]
MPRKKQQPIVDTAANGDASMDTDGPVAGPSSAGGAAARSQGGVISESIRKQMSLEGIEAYEMPKAVLARVAKAELPENVQIRREALLAISKSATIFISYLAAVSDELAKQNNRKTIMPVDVVEGLGLMEFPEEIRQELKREVREFKVLEEEKKKRAPGGGGATAGGDASPGPGEDGEEEGGDEEEGGAARDTSAMDATGAGAGDDDDDQSRGEQEDQSMDAAARVGTGGAELSAVPEQQSAAASAQPRNDSKSPQPEDEEMRD